jgi:hypothetical protein
MHTNVHTISFFICSKDCLSNLSILEHMVLNFSGGTPHMSNIPSSNFRWFSFICGRIKQKAINLLTFIYIKMYVYMFICSIKHFQKGFKPTIFKETCLISTVDKVMVPRLGITQKPLL